MAVYLGKQASELSKIAVFSGLPDATIPSCVRSEDLVDVPDAMLRKKTGRHLDVLATKLEIICEYGRKDVAQMGVSISVQDTIGNNTIIFHIYYDHPEMFITMLKTSFSIHLKRK